MPSFLLAHDLGTSGNKATLFSEQGELVASCTRSYDTHFFHGNWAEQNPDDWWDAVCATTRQLLSDRNPATIACVTLSGQMMGCTPVDQRGRALRPSILYCDQRSEAEAEQLRERIALTQFYQIVGHRISPSYTLEKLMWLKVHEESVYRQTHVTLCAKDYINFQLTGQLATDFSDASGTNAFDLNTFRWSDQILELADIERGKFPIPRPSTDILGSVTAQAAAATGLLAGTPVAVGGGDGSCAGVGVGCVAPGSAYNYLGSSSWIALTVKQPIVDPHMRTMNWAHCVPGYLHPSGTMQAAGSSYQWLKNTVCTQESAQAAADNVDVYELINRQISESPPGANGVIFLPYMLGERTPRWNPQARGAFIGLNLATTRADMLRAVMEGISMNLGLIVDIFRNHVPLDRITVIGGGAKGAVWRQMLADIYNCRIEKPNYLEEATSMGAAVIGGVAIGLFDSFHVIDRFIHIEDVVEPIPEHQAVYRKIMPVFDKCYRDLVEVFSELSQLN